MPEKSLRMRYRPNNREFGKLMMGHQTQRLADTVAKVGEIDAKQMAMEDGLPERYVNGIQARLGPPMVLGGNPRRTARLVATDAISAAIEFGSGRRRARPQGGHSRAYRILGRAGAKIATLKEFQGDNA